ncbi:MAG TPA: sugar nucleotide-binding protein [Gemmataceae bacterium]|nr:sugar nucleotide-binding protein [Gemmataceae bacterium]
MPLALAELPTPRLPLLITGITGVAGYNAFHYFRDRYPGQVIGTRPRRTWRLTGPGVVVLDAEDGDGMRDLFRAYRFGSVLNAVGNCALKSCELDPTMARTVNVASAASVVAGARAHGARLVHLSSDLVFSGKGAGGYVESDPVDPVTVYGRTMVQGEAIIRDGDPSAAVLRISLPMGVSFNGHAGAIDWIQSRFRAGRPATLYFDEVRSCAYTDDLNRAFERFLAGDEAGPLPPRAGNVSMDGAKLAVPFGGSPFRAWPVGDDLWPTDREWHRRREPGEEGSPRRIAERLYRYPDEAR